MDLSLPSINHFSRSELNKKFSHINWNPWGSVSDVVGTVVEARLPKSNLGMVVNIEVHSQENPIMAEVVGFKNDKTLLLPFSNLSGISPGAKVKVIRMHDKVEVGDHLLGQIVDPFLQPLQENFSQKIERTTAMCIDRDAPNPMNRVRIDTPFSLGIKAIDSLLTFAQGQRVGIMAGSGVGKSVLLGMIANGADADVNVIALIGERGREVREFIERDLGSEGLRRSVVIVVTSDQSPLLRIRGAKVATAVAEYLSARGKNVLLMMDSLTRVAQAQREVGLAVGEPPTAKGYPPSVFSLLPRLLERCGPQRENEGSISGLYTVLVDGDDFNDPMPDAARAILDGHIQLSRSLANKGHFPAIDITGSVSRVMRDIVSQEHWNLALKLKELISVYNENFDYLQIGTYQAGSNPTMDLAIQLMPKIERFLRQASNEKSSLDEALMNLRSIFSQ
ncbi:MAG: FliI/YscN family ATPase [Bdellovibrionota bacterium]